MSFESIVQKINALPPLPKSVQEIQKVFSMPDPDVGELVNIIESDPILTCDILAEANAPIHSFSNKITSIKQVVTLLGTTSISYLALSSSTKKNFELNLTPYGLSNDDYSNMCNMQLMLMFQWYMGIDVNKSKVLIPLIFLSELGKILIANEVSKSDYADMFQNEIKKSKNTEDVEEMFAGITTSAVNTLLYKHWNFDSKFIDIMEYLTTPDKEKSEWEEYANAIKVVHAAINVNERLSEESIKEAVNLARMFGYDALKFEKTAYRIKNKLEQE